MLPHGFGCERPPKRRGATTVVGVQPLFGLLCGRADGYRHWSARGLGPTRRSGRSGQSQLIARCRYPAPHAYRTSTAAVKYATNAPDLSKPSRAAPQSAMTAAHRRCRHDAASSIDSMQEMPKLKAQLESQARSACVVQTASLCTPLATCRIRRSGGRHHEPYLTSG